MIRRMAQIYGNVRVNVVLIFTTFLVFLTVDEVRYISNKNQPPNNFAKRQYFYTRDFISFFHFERKLMLFIAKPFRKHPFLTTFSLF